MLINKDIKESVYSKLMNYIFDICDTISLVKYADQHGNDKDGINKILLKLNYSKNNILEKYDIDNIDKLINKLIRDENIFDKKYKDRFEINKYDMDKNSFEELKIFNRKKTIEEAINQIIYNKSTDLWLKENENNIVYTLDNILDYNYLENKIYHSTTYYFKLNNELKKQILNNSSLYGWCFPNYLEDICFFKNGYCWLYSVAHEKLCEIYCRDEKEYEYLKSIGIEFVNNKYIPSKNEKLYYEE